MAEVPTGIDLGTSNSVIGVFINGKITIVPNSIGDSLTPSVVEILEKGEAIGEETIMHKENVENTITEIKRIIGKKYSEIEDLTHINFNIVSNNDNIQIKVNRKGKEELFTPEEIMSLIFKKLIKNASDFVKSTITKAVITVPANYSYNQRSAIVKAANLAGIEVLRTINEPTAAALAYGLGTKENNSDSLAVSIIKKDNVKNRKVLVFDLGGGTFDVTILVMQNNIFNVEATKGDTHLGGNDFDNILVDYCIKDFCQKMNVNENDIKQDPNSIRRLKAQCEKAKKKLSNNDSSSIRVYNFYNNMDLSISISRERFNQECEDLYKRIELILDEAIKDSKFNIDEIDDIILIGGSSRIPKVKKLLEEKFGKNKIKDNINQDEAVAIGATWQAHKLIQGGGTMKDINILDITPFSLGVGSISKIKEERKYGHIMSTLIEKNSKIPIRSKTQIYKTISDNQTFFKIQIFSGEEKFVKNNKLLKEFKIEHLPEGKAGSVSLTISFEVDVNGILIINAEVESIGKKVTEKYSLYENDSSEKKKLKHSVKPKEIEKLNEIKQITDFINEKNDALKNVNNDNEKKEFLNDLIESCLNIINIYESLKEESDSNNIYEKIFDYTKILFNYYSKLIILDNEDKNTTEILKKIKEMMPKFIDDNIENLIDIFNELKTIKPKIYIEIILFCAEILYKEGDRILEERKQYSRYYSKKFYQKAEKIRLLIDADLEKKMNMNLTKMYKEIIKKYESKVAEINAFVSIIKDQVEGKKPPFFKNTGFTAVGKILHQNMEKLDIENIYLILDIFQDMADSFGKGEPSKAEAFCLVNIMDINFTILKKHTKSDIKLYNQIKSRIDFICEKLEIDPDDKETHPNWYAKYLELSEKIDKIGDDTNISPDIIKKKEEIKDIFDNKMKEQKPMEFLDLILEKYPCINFNASSINKENFENYFIDIFPKYHPDNYKGRDDFIIYNEIYMCLVKIDEEFFNKNKK